MRSVLFRGLCGGLGGDADGKTGPDLPRARRLNKNTREGNRGGWVAENPSLPGRWCVSTLIPLQPGGVSVGSVMHRLSLCSLEI